MKESTKINNLSLANLYHNATKVAFDLKFSKLDIENGIKNWNHDYQNSQILALFGSDEDNLNQIIRGLAGLNPITKGEIFLNHENITFLPFGWERKIAYFGELKKLQWNKLFSVQYNLTKRAERDKNFINKIVLINNATKVAIANLKNTGLSIDCKFFKQKLINLIKNYIEEIKTTRNLFINEYEFQINHFHQDYAKNKFNFPGSEILAPMLIKKFTAEEENIIANNNLLFYQSLQDRILSIETLVGECNCGCRPKKQARGAFRLREIHFVLKEINQYLNEKIANSRKNIRATLKSCNVYHQNYNNELNKQYSFQKIKINRSKVDQIIEDWVDKAEVQRIKFNMKQDFISMQILPDEMQLLLKNIKEEIKIYHKKLLKNPEYDTQENYNLELKQLQSQFIDIRDLVHDNILTLFNLLKLSHLLTKKIGELSFLEKRIITILQQLVLVTKILVLEDPFELLEKHDKEQLANWLKIIHERLKIMIIFASRNQKDISLLANSICIIENEQIVQMGEINIVTTKPLTLNLLKEMNNNHLNVFAAEWYKPDLVLCNIKIGSFPTVTTPPIVAVRSSDIIFSLKKPRFNFFYKNIIIAGKVKHINRASGNTSYLVFATASSQLYEVEISNHEKYQVGTLGYLVIERNVLYIFDGNTQQLIGTH